MKKGNVALFIVENNIKSELELMNLSVTRRDLGDRALYDYLISLRGAARQELVRDAWTFENSRSLLADENPDRMDLLRQQCEKPCICNGVWLECANEILTKNKINKANFCKTLRTTIEKGRSKHTNVMLIGPADCGKTFLLDPIVNIIRMFFKTQLVQILVGLV